ncbi:MAG: PP2C family protein-serine/threonine phosphatase [Acidobacteriota bacterium]
MSNCHQNGRFHFLSQSRSDVGRVRTNNEDALIEVPEIGLFGVCDGLGGHAAGEVASSIASRTLTECLGGQCDSPDQALREGLGAANRRILQGQLENPQHRGMGTTTSLLWMTSGSSNGAWIAHIGDSRIYRLRGGEFRQLTQDHSPVFRLYEQGILSKDEIQEHPQKNLLDRSLGITPTVDPDIFPTQLLPRDLILICTDGLTDALKDRKLQTVLQSIPFQDASDRLVADANAEGGQDNITLILIEIVDVI